ncbi:hypothetical protein PG988_010975 [Apiospora saccharicola]
MSTTFTTRPCWEALPRDLAGHAGGLEDAVDVEYAAAGKSAGEPEPDEDDAAGSVLVPLLPVDEPQDGLGGRGEDDIGGLAAGLAVVDARVEQEDAVLAHRHRHGAGAAGGGGRRGDDGEVSGWILPPASKAIVDVLVRTSAGGKKVFMHVLALLLQVPLQHLWSTTKSPQYWSQVCSSLDAAGKALLQSCKHWYLIWSGL